MWNALKTVWHSRDIRVVTLTLFCLGFTFASAWPYQSLIAIDQLGFKPRAFAALLAAGAIIGMVGNVVIGHFSDLAANRKQAILVALTAGAFGFGLFALLPSQATFLFCMLVVVPVSTSSYGQLFAVIRTITAETPGEAASINSAVRAVYAASWIIVPGLVGAWIAFSQNVSDSFGIAALAYLICVAIYAVYGPSGGSPNPPVGSRWAGLSQAVRLIAARPIFLRILALALIGLAHPLNAAVLPLLVEGPLQGTTRDIGLLAGLIAGLEIPFMILAGSACRRMPTYVVVAMGGLTYAVFALGLSQATALWQVYALTVVGAAGAAVILSLFLSYLQDLLPDRPGLGTSLMSIEGVLARAGSAATFALIGTTISLSGALLIGGLAGIAGVVLLISLELHRAPVRI
jgi:predicted MFS family arabinose efflux permease